MMSSVALQMEDLPHYTYDDYIQWEGSWELIRGIPFAMTPAPAIKHQAICVEIVFQLKSLLKDCPKCKVLLPVDWQITEDTVVQPDVLVVCADPENLEGEKLEIPPVLVFEVLSPSTTRKDRILKYQLYEQAGVKYYCIVDPETKSADVFVLQKEKYHETGVFKDGKMLFDLGPCKIQLDFSTIFTNTF
jgi:Uma2 family endonuclease